MVVQKQVKPNWLQVNVIRTARIHFFIVFVYGAALIAADAGKLYAPQDVLLRWKIAAVMLSIVTIIWYVARRYVKTNSYYQALAYILIILDIWGAAYSVYIERGMASNSVAMFAFPIAVATILYSRTALFATAALCTAAYWFACVRYFVLNFNQGYKLELYTTLSFYSAGFFLLAALLWIVVRQIPQKN